MDRYSVSRGRSRKKNKINKVLLLSLVAVLILVIMLIYLGLTQLFYSRFLPNTYIADLNISYKTIEQVNKLIDENVLGYKINIKSRSGSDTIYGKDIGLKRVESKMLEDLLAQQRPIYWLENLFTYKVFDRELALNINEDEFSNQLSTKSFMNSELYRMPSNAKISDYEEGKGYSIVEGDIGNTLDKDLAKSNIRMAILKLKSDIDLDLQPNMSYISSSFSADSSKLKETVDILNKYVGAYIEYKEGYIIDSKLISKWLVLDDNYNVGFDDNKINEFVDSLAATYKESDNINMNFKTSYGKYVNISSGDFDRNMNKRVEASVIKSFISSAYKGKREPEFAKKRVVNESNQYGDTYLEINLSKQRLFFYKAGDILVETDIISGDEAKGLQTPVGVYRVFEKIEKDLDTDSKKAYKLKFTDALSIYAEEGRSSFGADIYKSNGSEEGIILPLESAKLLYDNVDYDTMVFCYKLEDGDTSDNSAVQESTQSAEAITDTQLQSAESQAEISVTEQSTSKISSNNRKKNTAPRANTTAPVIQSATPAPTQATETQASSAVAKPKVKIIKEPIRAFRNGPGVERTIDYNEKGPGIPKSTEAASSSSE